MPLQSLGEQRKNVSLTHLEPKREVAPAPDYVESERDWRSYRKPPEQIFYSDTGHGYVKQYQRKPRDFMERRQPQGVFASDVGVMYGLRPAYPSPPLNREEWLFDLQISEAQKEIKFTRMVSKLDISQEEKERLLSLYVPGAAEAITYGKAVTASHSFYRGLGYPEFGGRYAPFTVPSGAKVKGISETSEGLKIEFEPSAIIAENYFAFKGKDAQGQDVPLREEYLFVQGKEEPLKLPKALGTSAFTESLLVPVEKKVVKEEWPSETLYNVKLGDIIDPMASLKAGKLVGTEIRPFWPIAVFLAPFEWATYGLAMILRGDQGPIGTPPRTETFGQMVVSGSAKNYPSYVVAASLLGEFAFSEFLGKAMGIGTEMIGGVVKPVASNVRTGVSLGKGYLASTQTWADWKLASRGLAEGLVGEEPYMYAKNVLVPTVKGVYAPEIANAVRTQLTVLQGVPRQAIKDIPFLEETMQYRSGVLFNEPLASMIGSALITEDFKLAARGLAEGFIGSERYSYIKSVAVPMTRDIYIPEASQKVSTFFAVLHGVPAEAIKEIPNPVEAWQMYRSGVLFNEPFISIAFPHVAKPQDIMFLKSVFAPNIGQYYSLKMPDLKLDSDAWQFLTEPMKTAKAYGKVAVGKLRYEFNLPTPPSNVVEHTPLVFDVPKETAQVQRIAEASQVAIQVKPEESLSVTGMPKTFLGFLYPRTRQREEETEIEVLSYPASAMGFAVAKPIGQTDFLQQSHAIQGLSGFEVAPRLKPTTTISTVRTGLFKGLKGSSIMAPKSASRFTQSTNLKPMSLSESGLKLDQGLKQNMAQASRIAEQYQLKQKFQFPEEPFKRKGGRRKRKKAKGGIADWYVVDWPLSKPEDFMRMF